MPVITPLALIMNGNVKSVELPEASKAVKVPSLDRMKPCWPAEASSNKPVDAPASLIPEECAHAVGGIDRGEGAVLGAKKAVELSLIYVTSYDGSRSVDIADERTGVTERSCARRVKGGNGSGSGAREAVKNVARIGKGSGDVAAGVDGNGPGTLSRSGARSRGIEGGIGCDRWRTTSGIGT